MHEKWQRQIPLMAHIKDHPQSKEPEAISAIIDATPTICEKVLQKSNMGSAQPRHTGASGMSTGQVLRCTVVKVLFGFTILTTLGYVNNMGVIIPFFLVGNGCGINHQ